MYAGAALVLLGCLGLRTATVHDGLRRDVPLQRADWPWLGGIVVCGAVLGPLCLLIGLRQVPGVHGAPLLNLEAPLTILLAVLLFGEHLALLEVVAVGGILVGVVWLGIGADEDASRMSVASLWFGAAACCWAVDNNLTQRLSALRDPLLLRAVKTTAGGATLALAVVVTQAGWPTTHAMVVGLGVGAASYGISLWLDAQALRRIGAARQAAHFATAPFLGAVAAVTLLGERWGLREWSGAALMGVGIALLHVARHAHRHTHPPGEHAHDHSHDDEDHRHAHPDGVVAADAWHAHPHRHSDLTHRHERRSDLHPRHRHASSCACPDSAPAITICVPPAKLFWPRGAECGNSA